MMMLGRLQGRLQAKLQAGPAELLVHHRPSTACLVAQRGRRGARRITAARAGDAEDHEGLALPISTPSELLPFDLNNHSGEASPQQLPLDESDADTGGSGGDTAGGVEADASSKFVTSTGVVDLINEEVAQVVSFPAPHAPWKCVHCTSLSV